MEFIDLKTQYGLIKDGLDRRMKSIMESAQFIMGPQIAELETALAKYTGAKHAIACASGTDALLIALMALEIKPGDEVITTPFTFIATAEVIALLGAVPVFVDIDPRTYNIDPAAIEKAITPKTRAIIPVSLFGQCAQMDAINQIASERKIPVIEDAAQSLGAEYRGKKSCALSTIGCASFFPSKPLGCYGDGGACFTDDDRLATLMRQLRVHGQDKRYNHPLIGVNARMDTLQAAVLLEKLTLFPEEVMARQRIGAHYSQLLNGAVVTPFEAPDRTHIYAQYTIRIKNREKAQEELNKKGIPTAVHYPKPLHLQPAFAYLGLKEGAFPISEQASAEVMSLPMHPYLSDENMEKVAKAVREIA
ncbi:MAG: DegT/DnrJ/EryC1/StrS family aminotransferase [Nitrospinota bacterium]|nr:DegT/DnrJ/EryC1/StrS family aminotransferase [Nitrospinota bacterium]